MVKDCNGRAIQVGDLVTVEGKFSVAGIHDGSQYDVDLVPVDPHPSNGKNPIPIRASGSLVTLPAPGEPKADAKAEPAKEAAEAPKAAKAGA